MNDRLRFILAELHRHFEALYGDRLAQMILFGSQARGDAEPGSDIDILVVLNGPVQPGTEIARTGQIITNLSLRFDEVISCVFMDADRFAHRAGPLIRNIRKEGVAI